MTEKNAEEVVYDDINDFYDEDSEDDVDHSESSSLPGEVQAVNASPTETKDSLIPQEFTITSSNTSTITDNPLKDDYGTAAASHMLKEANEAAENNENLTENLEQLSTTLTEENKEESHAETMYRDGSVSTLNKSMGITRPPSFHSFSVPSNSIQKEDEISSQREFTHTDSRHFVNNEMVKSPLLATNNETQNVISVSTNTMNQDTTALPKPTKTDIEEANDEIANLLIFSKKITKEESSKLQSILREYELQKNKITKLKELLLRSSQATKNVKQELEAHKKLLNQSQDEVVRLNMRLEQMVNRPTHMDLLADFETNFDKALLSLHSRREDDDYDYDYDGNAGHDRYNHLIDIPTKQQSGGEATKDDNLDFSTDIIPTSANSTHNESPQTRERIKHLEDLNSTLSNRVTKLESMNNQLIMEKEDANLKITSLQLELRMAKIETEHATRAMKEKAASLAEMQMEIDLVTRSAISANVRAAEGMEVVKLVKTDKAHVQELEAKVSALQEWAVAAANAKEVISEHNKELQKRIDELTAAALSNNAQNGDEASNDMDDNTNNNPNDTSMKLRTMPNSNSNIERKLWTKSSSLVVGAGMSSSHIIELGKCHISDNEIVVFRWMFDITPSDLDIVFSIYKGRHEDKKSMKKDALSDAIIKDRLVQGGGGGEVQGAFVVSNACTLVWSNEHSWIRPRSIKYFVEAYAIM